MGRHSNGPCLLLSFFPRVLYQRKGRSAIPLPSSVLCRTPVGATHDTVDFPLTGTHDSIIAEKGDEPLHGRGDPIQSRGVTHLRRGEGVPLAASDFLRDPRDLHETPGSARDLGPRATTPEIVGQGGIGDLRMGPTPDDHHGRRDPPLSDPPGWQTPGSGPLQGASPHPRVYRGAVSPGSLSGTAGPRIVVLGLHRIRLPRVDRARRRLARVIPSWMRLRSTRRYTSRIGMVMT